MYLFTVDEMVAAEKTAAAHGHSYDAMMENAGRGVAQAVTAEYDVTDMAVFVFVGPGNNGGDALVAGRHLHHAGANIVFYLYKDRNADEDENMAQAQQLGVPILKAEDDNQFRVLRLRLNGADMIIDGLLGTGVSRPISGDLGRMMRQIRGGLQERQKRMTAEHEQKSAAEDAIPLTTLSPPSLDPIPAPPRPIVVAVDCPSGLHCNTGELDPLTLPADLTITFTAPKRGHFLYPGAGHCGKLMVADIGITADHLAALDEQPAVQVATPAHLADLLPDRPADGHKGTFGRLLIAAGSDEYRGAPVLAARGAFRAGAGLVALAVPHTVRETAVAQLPEATFPILAAEDHLDHTAEQQLLTDLGRYDAALIGPGLGSLAESFVLTFLTHLRHSDIPLPVVIDADGLNLLANRADWPDLLPNQAVLTPHPGEMARLCKLSLDEIKAANRIELALEKAQAWGCVLVLKGAHTVVAEANGRATVLPFANPVLSTAGSGDVLGGVITTFLAQGMEPYAAAVVGGGLHGLAGELGRDQWGDAGLVAGELADYLPEARSLLQ